MGGNTMNLKREIDEWNNPLKDIASGYCQTVLNWI